MRQRRLTTQPSVAQRTLGSFTATAVLMTSKPPLIAAFALIICSISRAEQPPISPDEALPRVRWHEAEKAIGKIALVSGKIEQVGHIKTISFLNFDPRRRDVFKLIVREAHRDNFPKSLDELYKGKIIEVRGRVTVYAGVPQIQVVNPDQIAILDELPPIEPIAQPRITPRQNLTVATFNVRNLFDANDDPFTHDETTPTKPRAELRCLANIIRELNADVLALQEVESRGYLKRVRDVFLADMGYEQIVHYEGNDMRGIDVCLMTRLDVGPVTSYRHLRFVDDNGDLRGLNRDILRVELRGGSQPFEVWVLHLKSNSGGREAAEPIRLGEVRQIRRLLDQALRQDPQRRIIVCGDFNDTAESATVRGIVGSGKNSLQSFWKETPETDRITYNLEPHRSMIDFILCSPAMAANYISGTYRIRSGSLAEVGSDHNPVVAEFKR